MSFADHFSIVSARYAQYRPRYPRAVADVLAERSPATDVAWDIGCGSGQLTVTLAERFARVIATDPAQAQLDQAPALPNVEYRRATAEDSGLPDASVDLAVVAQAAHWFDWPRFIAEVGRVARPGALVALVTYGNVAFEGDAPLVAFYRDVLGPYWSGGRVHVETGYADLALPWPAVEAPVLPMEETWTRDELLGYVSTWSATAKLVSTVGTAPVEQLARELAVTWPEAGAPRRVRWPLTIKLARR